MGLSCSRIGPCQKAEVPSRRGVDSSPFRKTAIHRHGRGTRRLPGSARRIADCRHQSIGRHRSYQNTRRMYPSHSAPDSRYSEKTNSPTGGARTILLHVKYIPPRLAGFARSRASQGTGPQSGNIANCDQRTFQALPRWEPRSRLRRGSGGSCHRLASFNYATSRWPDPRVFRRTRYRSPLRWATRADLFAQNADSAPAAGPKSEMATFVPWKADQQTQARFPDQSDLELPRLGRECVRVSGHTHESVATVVEVGDNGMLKEFSAERDAPGRFDLICR